MIILSAFRFLNLKPNVQVTILDQFRELFFSGMVETATIHGVFQQIWSLRELLFTFFSIQRAFDHDTCCKLCNQLSELDGPSCELLCKSVLRKRNITVPCNAQINGANSSSFD